MQNKRRILMIAIVLLGMIAVANPRTIDYLKGKIFGTEKGTISLINEIETTHSSQIIYEKLDNGLLQYWEGILIYYNYKGEQLWSANLSIHRPTIKTSTDSIFVVDEAKNQVIRINKKGEMVYKNTLARPYSNINVCDNNYAVIYHNVEGPIQYITILDENGSKSSEITLSEGMVTGLAISKSNDKVAISTIGTNGERLENNLSIYDLKGNLLGIENFKNNIIIHVFFNKNGDLLVFDESNIFSMDKNNKIKWETEFKGKLSHVSKSNTDYMTFYTEDHNKNSIIYSNGGNKIKTIDYSGKSMGELKVKDEILGIDNFKNDIIAHSLRTVFRVGKEGNIILEYPYPSDILKSYGLSEEIFVVITKEKVSFLQFRKK